MTKSEAFHIWRNKQLGISASFHDTNEAAWMIKHYSLEVYRNAHMEEVNTTITPPQLDFAEDEKQILYKLAGI